MSETLTDRRLAEIHEMSQRAVADRRLHLAVPELLAEVQRLREVTRWRTVSADGLPEAGVRVLVRRPYGDEPHDAFTFEARLEAHDEWKYWDTNAMEWRMRPAYDRDCWLSWPGENE